MFASMVHRLWRRPWRLALLGGLVVLLGGAFLLAGLGWSSLFGLPWEAARSGTEPSVPMPT